MIEVKEAIRIIDNTVVKFPAVKVPIEKALGRVLRENIRADTDFPPFDRVMMDGIAIRMEDFEKGRRTFIIQGVQAAGAAQMRLKQGENCLEVMTGAVTPVDSNVVVPYEEVQIDNANGTATIQIDQLVRGKNIHVKGTDKKEGDVLLEKGVVIDAPEMAVAASVGKTEILVTKNPRVAIISTGDELVDINTIPLPHQIRRSNVYALLAELKKFGIKSDLYHFTDEKEKLKQQLNKVLNNHDVIVMSGGVSKGKFDFVPEALKELGVKEHFHRIQQKPGKPLWFGSTEDKKVVFAFPGNPVSTFLCFHKYFIPWFQKSIGNKKIYHHKAVLAEDVSIKTRLTYFLQVETYIEGNGQLVAIPKVGRGSGDHANLLVANAFLELPANTYRFKKGEIFNLISFRNR
jgi:molybdopterin molybdotransferase